MSTTHTLCRISSIAQRDIMDKGCVHTPWVIQYLDHLSKYHPSMATLTPKSLIPIRPFHPPTHPPTSPDVFRWVDDLHGQLGAVRKAVVHGVETLSREEVGG